MIKDFENILAEIEKRNGSGKWNLHLTLIQQTKYRYKGRYELPFPGSTTTWGARSVSLVWNFDEKPLIQRADILIHEARHQIQAVNRNMLAWWAYYLANANKLEAEAYAAQAEFLG